MTARLVPRTPPPEAEAGADQSGGTGLAITLDGSGSSDADGDSLSYSWTENPGNPVTGLLSDAATVSPTFTPTEFIWE